MCSDLLLLCAPPGFRTQNLRIKSRLQSVSARAAGCCLTCSGQV